METQNIKGVLFDLDGVFYVGEDVIPGAIETLQHIQSKGIAHRFVTNTSTKKASEVAEKLTGLGFEVGQKEIFSAVSATLGFLDFQKAKAVHPLVRNTVKSEFEKFDLDSSSPDYVVVGDIGAAWDYTLLNRVFRELMNGARLIAMHKNKYWQTSDGLQMDIGAFVAGLEYVSSKQSIVIGKPSENFFHLGTQSMGLNPSECLMIGDDIENDVGGAQAAGLKGVLVRTGKFREELLKTSSVQPDEVVDSVADLKKWF